MRRPATDGDRTAAGGSSSDGDPDGERVDGAGPGGEVRWSDPFERLTVGQRFQGGERVVRDTDVIVFCALSGDWHPQHCDPDWARDSPFGECIAHGLLVLSLAVGLVPLDAERVLALRRIGEVVFKRPVRLEDTISVDGEVTALRTVDASAGLVDFAWAIRNQERALVARAKVQLLWRREPVETTARTRFWHESALGSLPPGDFVPVPL